MWATSDGPEQGSTFNWYIIVNKLQGKPPSALLNPLNERRNTYIGKRVLLVEPCDTVRNITLVSLKRSGYLVKAVKSETEAIKSLILRSNKEWNENADISTCSKENTESCLLKHQLDPSYLEDSISEGPFDVVIMDSLLSNLLRKLMYERDPREAQRIIFLDWPGQTSTNTNANSEELNMEIARSDSLAHKNSLFRKTADPVVLGNTDLKPLIERELGTWKDNSLNAELNLSHDVSPSADIKSINLEDYASTGPLGYVIVSRPVRQGRLQLGLEEVLELKLDQSSGEMKMSSSSLDSEGLQKIYQKTTSSEKSDFGSQYGKCQSFASSGSLLQAPLRKVSSSSSLKECKETEGNANKRLLIAEDNVINMKVALGILKRLGFTWIETANDGTEAVEAVKAANGPGSFHAILMDLHMPRMGGIDAVKEIKRLFPNQHTTIIAVTADAFEDTRDTCVANGFTGWLAKPFRVEEFAKIMSEKN